MTGKHILHELWLVTVVVCMFLTMPMTGMVIKGNCLSGDNDNFPGALSYTANNESISIIRPLNGLYLFDLRIVPLVGQVVFGMVSVEVVVSPEVARVEFLLMPKCGCRMDVMFNDTRAPFTWIWDGDSERVFDDGLAVLSVWGYDVTNHKVAEDSIMLLRIPL